MLHHHLQEAFMQLGQLIMDVGRRIAALCDRYVARRRSQQQQEHAASLAQVLLSSRCPKGRLLHYFPLTEADLAAGAQEHPDQWCGWHKDHGSLTGEDGMVTTICRLMPYAAFALGV